MLARTLQDTEHNAKFCWFQAGGERRIRVCVRQPNLIEDVYNDANLLMKAALINDPAFEIKH